MNRNNTEIRDLIPQTEALTFQISSEEVKDSKVDLKRCSKTFPTCSEGSKELTGPLAVQT